MRMGRWMGTLIAIATAIIVAVSVGSLPLHAADINSVTIKGDVSEVEIIRSNGTYLETLLHVWDYSPTSTPFQPIILRCNGNGGGTLTNCLYPSAFLACTKTRTDTIDIYEPTLVSEHYACTLPARRDAGECVVLSAQVRLLDSFEYAIYADGHSKVIQAISLDVTNVGYETGCTSKP